MTGHGTSVPTRIHSALSTTLSLNLVWIHIWLAMATWKASKLSKVLQVCKILPEYIGEVLHF